MAKSRINSRLNRYRQIGTILAKHGFGDMVSGIPLANRIKLRRIANLNTITRWERVRLALEELGPSFIKLGQIMSSRNDLLPEDLLFELAKLRENVPPFSSEVAEQILINQTGLSIEESFSSFDSKPFASASIGQVHRAILLNGEKVVVKIRRPDIEVKIKADIEIMKGLAILIEKNIRKVSDFNIIGIVEEFEKSILKELDLYLEATNIERFAAAFPKQNKYYIPKVYREYSSKNVLIMEYIEGVSPLDIERLDELSLDRKEIAITGATFVLEQIFKAGFFHGDPHEGNIKILPDGRICFLDYGLMGTMSRKTRMQLGDLLIGFVKYDPERLAMAILDITNNKHYAERSELEDEISLLMEKYAYLPFDKIDFGGVLGEMMDLVYKHKIKLPSSFYLLGKTIVTIEVIARELHKDFVIIDYLKPYAKNIIKERLSLKAIAKDSSETFEDMLRLIKVLPREVKDILEQIKTGKTRLQFEHSGLEDISQKVESTGNRVSFSLLTAALVLGSSIMTVSHIPPLWNGVSILGLLGFTLSGVMSIVLLVEIIRHGKL